ncbi:glycoside hydrolase family 1 protein [Aspergillus saccharolyticus JOP 1030-1]|uniref:beta-glucosidase n=1 Tax=Aspergillus saccharolyticus JOP 1030-1 TaxID=1450539 RepID=A0A319AG08_9EURO|nr:glycoside hydrolase [Aspergillus saccharolyticus JOP 1030-1]PYH45662.1 glycoside hydrolase [Aspergillus saccharolyticus JOP 1030-1]
MGSAPASTLPKDFLWGFATASYQIEGAVTEDGRGPSIWDTFCKLPGKIADGSSGEVACDSYHRGDEDIALLQQCGAKAYRFSISWSRIIPLGGRNDPINQKGLDHYIRFLDALHAANITPLVTLYHWDLPDALEQRYGGLRNKDEFVADFTHYARTLFAAFGSRVKHWITFNEPWCSAVLGYNVGQFAPGRTSDRSKSAVGDGSREPWIVGHNLLVAHGAAVKVYREEFKGRDGGEIGITLNGDWAEPWDPSSPADIEACTRKIEFAISWFADPIYHGKYPDSMVQQLGDRLPRWTPEELALVHGSNDFYGMNHYCANYIKAKTGEPDPTDTAGNLEILLQNKAGEWIGPETQSAWLRPCAAGFRKLLKWLSDRYGRPKIYVTENGTSLKGENDLPVEELLRDEFRVQYFRDYIAAMADAYTLDGVDVRAYMAWSLMDNFEWAEGYETRFGVTYVDYENGQKRIPKESAKQIGKIFEQYIGKE